MVCARVLQQQQGQPQRQQLQHSQQWGPKATTVDLHRERFGPHAITPHWPSRLRQRTAAPVESHLPGLGPFPAARVETCVSSLGACVVSSLGASESLCVGATATTSLAPAFVDGSGATSQTAQLSFTLDSRASSCYFRDCTDLTPLRTPVTVALADPSMGPVIARSTTTLPCPVAPSEFLTGYYTPSFSRKLVGASHLHDLGVVTIFPLDEPIASCTVGATGAPLATFHRELGYGLYSLHTGSHHNRSGQVRSGQVAAVSYDCRSLTHLSVLWHHPPLPRSTAPPCTPCVEGRHRAAPHSSSFPPTTAPFQTLHLDICGPSPVLGPRQERYFLIVVDDYSRYTTVFPLRRKADVPTVLEPWLVAWGGAQGLCGFCLHSDHGVPYAAHQLNQWPSDARPRVMPVSLWTRSPSVATHFRVWGSLAHVCAPGANNLSPHTRACLFLGFHLDASEWVLYDPVTYEFFASQDVRFNESVCYYRSRPHRGTEVFPPPLFLTFEPPPVAPRPVPVVSGGAGGAVAEGEGNGAAGAGGVGSGGAGGVGVEVTPPENTASSTRWPRLASPPSFPSVLQFPPRSSLRPVAAEPGGVPAGGTGGPGGVGGGGAGSGVVGAGGTCPVLPTPRTVRFLTQEESRVQQRVQLQSQQERVEEESWPYKERVEQESRPQQQVHFQTQHERVEEPCPQQERVAQESQSQQRVQLQPQQERAEEEQLEQQ
ncbi:unnamed protein product [Closterium sp. NIES-54]